MKKKDAAPAPKEKQGASDRQHFLALAFLGVSVFLAYAGSLHGTWAFDDSAIGQFSSIDQVLNLRLGYRKVSYLSFLINRWINPEDPLNYRILNIIIHVVNSFLVYIIALRTLRLPEWKEKYGRYSFAVALTSAAVFALHPININAVSYIVQRMTSLSALFVLAALLSYLSARTSSGRGRAAILYGVTLICIFLGIFSKENAVLAVPLLLLYDYIFLVRFNAKELLRKNLPGLAVALLSLAVLGLLPGFSRAVFSIARGFLNINHPIEGAGWTAIDVYWTPLQHILTEFRVIGRYLFILFAPLPRFLVFDWWGYPISTGITEPLSTLISLVIVISAISFSFITRRRMPFLAFGILWYFIGLSLESFIGVGGDLYFEHRNYLPSAGLFFGIAAQLLTSFKGAAVKQKYVWGIVLLLSAILGSLTFQRNLVWKDSVTLWQDTLKKAPGNVRAMIAMGNACLKKPDFDAARDFFSEAVKVSRARKRKQFFFQSLYSLGMTDLFLGDLPQAEKVIGVMERLSWNPYSYRTSILRAFYRHLTDDEDGAIGLYEEAMPMARGLDRVIVQTLLGDAYRGKGQPADAIDNYRKALQLDPSFTAAYYGMGAAYMGMRDINNATTFLQKTLALEPNNPLALADMSDILLLQKAPPEKALRYAEKAVSNASRLFQPYLAMGNVLIIMGKDEAADEFFRKAQERGLKDYMVPFSKARAYFMKGDRKKAVALLKEMAAMKNVPDVMRQTVNDSLKGM